MANGASPSHPSHAASSCVAKILHARQKSTGSLITRRRYEGGGFRIKVKRDLCVNIYEAKVSAEEKRKKHGRMPNE